MSADIAKSLFRNMATDGMALSDALFKTLTVRAFTNAIRLAANEYLRDPLGIPSSPTGTA